MYEEMDYSCSNPVDISASTQNLREKLRLYAQTNRDAQRHQKLDALRFGLNEIQEKILDIENLTEKDVEGLAKRIKRRKHATKDDMYRLSHSFIQSLNNIKTFSMIPGALQILVKELTGPNVAKKFYAAECFCNLSLGEAVLCEKLATMIGSYLVTFLDSNEVQIQRLSLWTLANIIDTTVKGTRTLLQMELISKLWHLYTDGSAEEDIIEFAGICLSLIFEKNLAALKPEDLLYIKYNFNQKNPTTIGAEYHLAILFHSNLLSVEEIPLLDENAIIYLVNFIIRNFQEVRSCDSFSDKIRIFYSIRILSNLLAGRANICSLFVHHLTHIWQENLLNIINKLFSFDDTHVTKETLWLLNNLCFNASNEDILRLYCPIDKLEIFNTLGLMI